MVVVTRSPADQPTNAVMGVEGSGGQALSDNWGERFQCPSCGYTRPIQAGEDGFRLYLLHEERCNPPSGGQLWLPCITEDDPVWSLSEERTAVFPVSSLVSRTDPRRRKDGTEHPLAVSRKAA